MEPKSKLPELRESAHPLVARHTLITERAKTVLGARPRARGPLAVIDVTNENNRTYPKTVWEKQIDKDSSLARRIESRLCFGELEHPESGMTHLARVSHLIEKAWIEDLAEGNEFQVPAGRYVVGEYMMFNTPNGQILQELHACGCPVGVSSRGRGDLIPDSTSGVDIVQDNYECETWDCVYAPSVTAAYTRLIKESQAKRPALDPVREAEAVLVAAKGLDKSDPISLIELGSRAAFVFEELKKADKPELSEKVSELRKKLVGQLVVRGRQAMAGTPKAKQVVEKKERKPVKIKQGPVAAMLVEMAARMVKAESAAKRPVITEAAKYTVMIEKPGTVDQGWTYPADYFPRSFNYRADAEKIADKARERGATGVRISGTGITPRVVRSSVGVPPAAEAAGRPTRFIQDRRLAAQLAESQKRLQFTTDVADELLTRALHEKQARVRLDRRYRQAVKLAEGLRVRGLTLARKIKVLESGRRAAAPRTVQPRPAQPKVSEAVGVKDPSQRRPGLPVSPTPSSTMIGQLAARGM